MANILLPEQDFQLGWELFEYGLCARAIASEMAEGDA